MPNTVQGSGDTADRKKKKKKTNSFRGPEFSGKERGTGGDGGGQM